MINIIIIIYVYYNSNIYYLNVEFNKNCFAKSDSPYHLDHHPGVDYLTCFEVTHHLHTGREGGREKGKEAVTTVLYIQLSLVASTLNAH